MGIIRQIKNVVNSTYAPLQSKLRLYYRPKQYTRKFGQSKGMELYKKFYQSPVHQKEVSFELEDYEHSLYLRPATSDVPTFQQIFLNTRYEMNLDFQPKTIIDGGSNIGFASVFYAKTYPEAEILAVEPDTSNFELIEKNTTPYHNITPLKSAIWGKSAWLKIKNPATEKWAFEVVETSPDTSSAFQAFSISDLIEKMEWQSVDLLKLDIEGAEMSVFEQGYEEWLPKVKLLIIELHEKLRPGCTEVFEKAISQYNFKKSVSGENLIYIRQPS